MRIHDELFKMKLSVVIPCYNELATIGQLLEAVRHSPGPEREIVVVDDCSTDGTRGLLEGPLRSVVDRLVLHNVNQGKGAALRSGFAAAQGEFVLIQDADLEYDPLEYPLLLEPLLNGKADVVFGSRFRGGRAHRVVFFWHYVANAGLTMFSNIFTNLNLSDMETGFKVFRREVLKKIRVEEERFGFEPEITAKVAALGCRVYEVGISYSGRTYEQGKKIGFKDALRAMWVIFKYGVFQRPRRESADQWLPSATTSPSRGI